jgi:branched-chain amino acid transport system ATP-binding protein
MPNCCRSSDPPALLRVEALNAWYGASHVLHDLSFTANEGEVTTLVGRNGAGKTTVLRAILGLVERRGSALLKGRELFKLKTNEIAHLGVAYCPEERGVFSTLTVRENLQLPPILAPGGMSVEELYKLFPNLAERISAQGNNLSGGEQQMLAIARILRTGAKFLLLDEPTEGLAPVIVEQIEDVIRLLRQRGLSLLLVEQNFAFAAEVADRHIVIENGGVVDVISRADAQSPAGLEKLRRYLGV